MIKIENKNYLSIQEAADICGMKYNTMYQHIAEFKVLNIEGKKLILKDDIDMFYHVRLYKKKLKENARVHS